MSTEFEGWTDKPIGMPRRAGALDQSEPMRSDSSPRAVDSLSASFDPATAYLDRLGPGSWRTIHEALTKLAGWASNGRCDAFSLPWHLLRIEHTAALRTRLASTLAPATANKHLAALRGVLKQCWRAGLMSAEAYQRAIDLPAVRGESPRKTNRLRTYDLYKLAQVCQRDPSPAGARDEALLVLLYGAHLRRSEAVALDLSDYDVASGELITLSSSSGKLRRFGANSDAKRALERWILIRGSDAGPFFNPVNKGGRIERRRLSEQAIYIACQKRAAEAGLPPTSPEDLRRVDVRVAEGAPSYSTGSFVGVN